MRITTLFNKLCKCVNQGSKNKNLNKNTLYKINTSEPLEIGFQPPFKFTAYLISALHFLAEFINAFSMGQKKKYKKQNTFYKGETQPLGIMFIKVATLLITAERQPFLTPFLILFFQ